MKNMSAWAIRNPILPIVLLSGAAWAAILLVIF